MSKTLIAYFSHSGNSYVVAKAFQKIIGGDLFEIKADYAYPKGYNDVVQVAKEELYKNVRPNLVNRVENMEQYDQVIIGYPNWWATMPMPCFTFLESYDFSNKTIIPFCTHEGSEMGKSESDIKKLCPQAHLLKGLAIRGMQVAYCESKINGYLKDKGM